MRKIKIQIILVVLIAFSILFLYSDKHKNADTRKLKEYTATPYILDDEESRDTAITQYSNQMFARETGFVNRLNKQNKLLNNNHSPVPGNWREAGPDNIGGNTPALAIDCTNHNIMIAGSASGGIWKSTNAGSSWYKTRSTPFSLRSIRNIIQNNRVGKENIWYASADLLEQGIFKSIDNGENWQLLEQTSFGNEDFARVYDLAVDPFKMNEDIIYAAVNNCIKMSNDGGLTWQNVLGTPNSGDIVESATSVLITSDGTFYAAGAFTTGSGMWRSTNGSNWTKISRNNFPELYTDVLIKYAPSNPNIIYMLMVGYNLGQSSTNDNQFWKYTYLNGDGSGTGGIWSNRSGNLVFKITRFDLEMRFESYGGYCLTLDVKPDDENFVLIGGVYLVRSKSGFADKENYCIGGSPNILHPDIQSGFFHPDDNERFVCGTDGGIYTTNRISSDSVEFGDSYPVPFVGLNNNYNVTQFYTVDLAPEGDSDLILGGTQDNGALLVKKDMSWFGRLGDEYSCAIAPIADNRIYYNSVSPRLYTSDRNYSNVKQLTPSLGTIYSGPFVLDPNNSKLFYAVGVDSSYRTSLILKNNDAPNATRTHGWESLSGTSVPNRITAMAISAENIPNVLYYGTGVGKIYQARNINTDPGIREITPPVSQTVYLIYLSVDINNSDKVIAVYASENTKGLWYTEDGGDTWIDIEGNLGGTDGLSLTCAQIAPCGNNTYYFVGTRIGLFSTDRLEGTSTVWAQEAAERIDNQFVTWMDYRESDCSLAVATYGRGVFVKKIGTATNIDNQRNMFPQKIVLEQNYPNPFNPSSVIKYSLPNSSFVHLCVYNSLGQLVKTLVNEEKTPGNHNIIFDGSNLAGGIYIYQLKVNDFIANKKMILLK